MLWQALLLLLAIWVLFLVAALAYLGYATRSEFGTWGVMLGHHIAAERRANALMREVLSTEQVQQVTKQGYVEIASPTIPHRTYRIPGAGGLVRVYDRGQAIMDLCLQPVESLPDGDVVVMHKLMIEANEAEYLERANRFAPGIISWRAGYL